MFFDKKDKIANEKTIYTTRPSMILGCKKAIFGVILLIIVLSISSPIISFIGEMQVYLITYVQLGLTRYSAIALFVIILLIILYIIWQLLSWYSVKYILTDRRIITQRGLLNTKKSYMPYNTIQDISSSQSIIGRLIGVGSISAYSAYDNNQIELKDIPNPDKVEDLIFSRMHNNLNSRHYENDVIIPESRKSDGLRYNQGNSYEEDFIVPESRMYDDDFIIPESRKYNDYENEDVIIPESRRHENSQIYESRQHKPKREPYYKEYFIKDEDIDKYSNRKHDSQKYDYYPEKDYHQKTRHKYEYEPSYEKDELERSINNAINKKGSDFKFEGYNQFNKKRNEISQEEEYVEDYYDEPSELYYNDPDEFDEQEEETVIEDNSSKNAIERHFKKFKK